MNSVNFTPNVSTNYANINLKQNNVSFKGLTKKPTAGQAKEVYSFAQKAYKFLFVPSKESVTKFENGFVYTEKFSKSGHKRISKKYELFSRKPSEIIEENGVTRVANRKYMKKDGTFDIEIIDTHSPAHKVSAKYDSIKDPKFNEYTGYEGGITLTYGDKQIKLSNEERLALKKSFDEQIGKTYENSANQLLRHEVKYEDFCNQYYKDPNVIGSAILHSPGKLKLQLKTVNTSLPYGMEAILQKIGK